MNKIVAKVVLAGLKVLAKNSKNTVDDILINAVEKAIEEKLK